MKLPFSALLFCLLLIGNNKAQNLIPDPGFELVRKLPSKKNNGINCTQTWIPANGAGDYYSKFGKGNGSAPKNIFGRQKPHSGNAYAGICIRKKFIEYIETKLSDTLIKGREYLIEFYVCKAERSIGKVKEFGVMFVNKIKWNVGDGGLQMKPSVDFVEKSGYKNKREWKKLSATYVADGDETAIIIGFFNYDKSKKFKGFTHYYIDDVSIIELRTSDTVIAKSSIIQSNNKFDPIIGTSIRLKNIFFDVNKSDLLPPSYAELDTLVSYLKDQSNATIQINGHTDNTGNEVQNIQLSNSRAKAVAFYLIANGIDEDRIRYIGYGSSQPIANNETEEGRYQNRRVEFILLKN